MKYYGKRKLCTPCQKSMFMYVNIQNIYSTIPSLCFVIQLKIKGILQQYFLCYSE